MTKRTKKLSLNKETVLDLQANALANVRGGTLSRALNIAADVSKACLEAGQAVNAQSEFPTPVPH